MGYREKATNLLALLSDVIVRVLCIKSAITGNDIRLGEWVYHTVVCSPKIKLK